MSVDTSRPTKFPPPSPALVQLQQVAADHPPPCSKDPHLWERQDRPAQVESATRCLIRCPLFDACEAAYLEQPDAWSGVTIAGRWTGRGFQYAAERDAGQMLPVFPHSRAFGPGEEQRIRDIRARLLDARARAAELQRIRAERERAEVAAARAAMTPGERAAERAEVSRQREVARRQRAVERRREQRRQQRQQQRYEPNERRRRQKREASARYRARKAGLTQVTAQRSITWAVEPPPRAHGLRYRAPIPERGRGVTGGGGQPRTTARTLPPTDTGVCGSTTGYSRHRTRGERACDACRAARSTYMRNYVRSLERAG